MYVDVAVVSHATIDHIVRGEVEDDGKGEGAGEGEVITVGGPVCYAGLMASRYAHNTIIVTRVGTDFAGHADMLRRRYGMHIPSEAFCGLPTTRFRLVMSMEGGRQRRTLYLIARCADITQEVLDVEYDACIVSPVMGEVGIDAIRTIVRHSGFTLLDPQGLLRIVGEDGRVSLVRSKDMDGLRVDAMKVDADEAYALTGRYGLGSLNGLSRYSDIVILSMDNRVFMYSSGKDAVYELTTDMLRSRDSTGAGDIFVGAYVSAYISSRDPVWALCHGTAAAYIALGSGMLGLDKVPHSREVEEYARMLLERVKH